MKFAKAGLLIASLALLAWAMVGGYGKIQVSKIRLSQSRALAQAAPEDLRARYVAVQAVFGPSENGSAEAVFMKTLVGRGWIQGTDLASLPASWCQATGKGAFFRHGWVWVGDAQGKVLKTIWFEPDLQAKGRLEWSLDGTQLRLRADGWRRWLNLEIDTVQGKRA